jgi:hypothetical protein
VSGYSGAYQQKQAYGHYPYPNAQY